jgi:PIN domain nuclease of toxin-antitoxin system
VIVLDTHVWIWRESDPERLSADARAAIGSAPAVGVSPISCWELATLAARGRIRLTMGIGDWTARALVRATLLPLTAEIAVEAGGLGAAGFHGDPADRLIYATAVASGAKLVTRDEHIRSFDPRRCIW